MTLILFSIFKCAIKCSRNSIYLSPDACAVLEFFCVLDDRQKRGCDWPYTKVGGQYDCQSFSHYFEAWDLLPLKESNKKRLIIFVLFKYIRLLI